MRLNVTNVKGRIQYLRRTIDSFFSDIKVRTISQNGLIALAVLIDNESMWMNRQEPLGSDLASKIIRYCSKYDGSTKIGKMLGNHHSTIITMKSDAVKWRGRMLIHITGRFNYSACFPNAFRLFLPTTIKELGYQTYYDAIRNRGIDGLSGYDLTEINNNHFPLSLSLSISFLQINGLLDLLISGDDSSIEKFFNKFYPFTRDVASALYARFISYK